MVSTVNGQKAFIKVLNRTALFVACAGAAFGQTGWTEQTFDTTSSWAGLNCVTHGNGLFVVGERGPTVLTSPNGVAWTKSDTLSGLYGVNSITYANGLFVAVGDNGTIRTSPDGVTWTLRPVPKTGLSFLLNSVIYGAGRFVAAGNVVLTSPDGITWTVAELPVMYLSSVTYGADRFVGVGTIYKDTVLTSTDGTTWTKQVSGTSFNLSFVAYGNGLFAAVGDSGLFVNGLVSHAILTSPDGSTWTKRTSGAVRYLSYSDGQFVALGNSDTILTSTDAVTWTKQKVGTTSTLNAVIRGNGLFVAVGNKEIAYRTFLGTILTSRGATGVAVQPRSAVSEVNGIKINAMNNTISVIFPSLTGTGRFKADIFTALGKRVYSAYAKPNNGTVSFPAAEMPAGNYFMSITGGRNGAVSAPFAVTR